MLKKQTKMIWGRKNYLLGVDSEGTKYWLTEPEWACDWYWSFGLIHTYTNNLCPERSQDIMSLDHWDNKFINTNKGYQETFQEFFYDSVLDRDELFLLTDYMKTFYTFKEMAEVCRHGYSWQTERAKIPELVKKDLEDEINRKFLPTLFKKIDVLLSENDRGE
jgi:hypothetical protein